MFTDTFYLRGKKYISFVASLSREKRFILRQILSVVSNDAFRIALHRVNAIDVYRLDVSHGSDACETTILALVSNSDRSRIGKARAVSHRAP